DTAGSAALLDSSGKDNHLTPTALMASDWKQGVSGNGLQLTSTRHTLLKAADAPSLDPTTAISLSLWLNANDWTGTPTVVSKGDTNSQFRLSSDGTSLQFSVRLAGGTSNATVSVPPPSTGTWHHVLGTYDGTAIRLFIDGAATEAISAGAPDVSTDPLTIG